jgi:hypothetical protein
MSRYLVATLLSIHASAALSQTSSPIEGVWRITERITPPGNPQANGVTITQTNPQPGLIIFTRGYYSEIYVTGRQPRPAVAPAVDALNLTDAEKIARYDQWAPFTANAGTYEINGSALVRRPFVAKNVDVMTGGTRPLEFRLEDKNTLWLIPTADRAATEPRTKLTRVE